MVVPDFLETFGTSLPSEPGCLWHISIMPNGFGQNWVEMFLKQCARWVLEGRKKGRRGNQRPATDLGERAGNKPTGEVAGFPNKSFMVVIRGMLNGNNDLTSSMQFKSSYRDVWHWEELIDCIEKIVA
jgi:hypothetical protein